jgi:hypothetical protein
MHLKCKFNFGECVFCDVFSRILVGLFASTSKQHITEQTGYREQFHIQLKKVVEVEIAIYTIQILYVLPIYVQNFAVSVRPSVRIFALSFLLGQATKDVIWLKMFDFFPCILYAIYFFC